MLAKPVKPEKRIPRDLLPRCAGQAEAKSQLTFGKVAAIVGVGVCVALLLLLLLFNGDAKDEFESFVPLSRQ